MNKEYFNNITGEMTLYPLRVKTEDEFTRDYGKHWRDIVCGGWGYEMNNYIGKTIDESNYTLIGNNLYSILDLINPVRYLYYNGWAWSSDMLVFNDEFLFKSIYLKNKINIYE